MTQHFTTPSPVNPTTEHGNWGTPPQKPKAWWKKPVVILPVAAFILGSGLGAMNKPEPVRVEVPGPERIVEKEKRVEVPVTPAACLTALDLADEAFGYAAEAMGFMSDAMTAAGNLDLAAITKANEGLDRTTPKMKALKDPMQAAKAECRASAK
jgi:hypothetical protein